MAELKLQMNENKSGCLTGRVELQKHFLKCLYFATEAHKEQKRKNVQKTPYINHPIGVAYILSEEAEIANLNLIEGCLLHDTVEDTGVTIKQIEINFGKYISDLVAEVTDDKALPKQERKNLQIVHAKTTSPQGKLVKLADKLYNLRDLETSLPVGWSEERRSEYFQWAFQVCEGLRGVCPVLEEKLDNIFQARGLYKVPGQFLAKNWPYQKELKPLICAANFSAEKHRQNLLPNASMCIPYINHVVSVALIVAEASDNQDPHILTAALLLDVVGKTDSSVEELSLMFGHDVGKLVTEVSCEHSVEDKLKNYIDRVASLSHNAKVIALATITDICQQPERFYAPGCLLENFYSAAFQLRTLLDGTLLPIEQKFDQIMSQQGRVQGCEVDGKTA